MRLVGAPCPNPECRKKTLSHPDHPHAFGYKEYEFVVCRSCRKKYSTEKYRAWLNRAEKEAAK